MHLGWQEILLIVLIALLLFGAKRIPDLAKTLGKGMREFRKGLSELQNIDEKKDRQPEEKPKG